MRYQTCTDLLVRLKSTRTLVDQWSSLRKILAALTLTAGMGLGILYFMNNRPDSSIDASEPVIILVSKGYLSAFQAIKPSACTARSYPRDLVPPGAIRSTRELSNENGQPQFRAAVPLPEGQPLTRSQLIDSHQNHGMSSLLPPGKVAVSFSVDRVRGVGGWIEPGDTIAIFESSHLLFPFVEVLSVDKKRLGDIRTEKTTDEEPLKGMEEPSETEMNVVTVFMNPLEAAALTEARERNHLSAALRATGDVLPWDLK